MGFSLTTFLAQLVNLFLLIWLLKRFLYRPVMDIIDKRRAEIANNIHQADQYLADADKKLATLEKQQTDWEKLRQKRLDELDRDIQLQKSQMMKELQLDYQTRRNKMQDNLDYSWTAAENNIREMFAQEFMDLSQKVLSEWSEENLMDKVVSIFIKQLLALSKNQHLKLQKIISNQKVIEITSSESLTKKQQNLIRLALQKNFVLPAKLQLHFKKKKELLLGIEMRLDTFMIDWTLNAYLDEVTQRLKQNISGLIDPAQRKAEQ